MGQETSQNPRRPVDIAPTNSEVRNKRLLDVFGNPALQQFGLQLLASSGPQVGYSNTFGSNVGNAGLLALRGAAAQQESQARTSALTENVRMNQERMQIAAAGRQAMSKANASVLEGLSKNGVLGPEQKALLEAYKDVPGVNFAGLLSPSIFPKPKDPTQLMIEAQYLFPNDPQKQQDFINKARTHPLVSTEAQYPNQGHTLTYQEKVDRDLNPNDSYVMDKNIPRKIGGQGKTPLQAGQTAMIETAHNTLQDLEKAFFDVKPGTQEPDWNNVNRTHTAAIYYNIGDEARRDRSKLEDILQTKLRLETGAQANPSEIESIMSRYLPNPYFDGPKTIREKMRRLNYFFDTALRETDPALFARLKERAASKPGATGSGSQSPQSSGGTVGTYNQQTGKVEYGNSTQ